MPNEKEIKVLKENIEDLKSTLSQKSIETEEKSEKLLTVE
jgi:SMC interacting uncharacterized protein involved in chromosome segregation